MWDQVYLRDTSLHKKNNFISVLSIIIVLIIVGFMGKRIISRQPTQIVSPLADEIKPGFNLNQWVNQIVAKPVENPTDLIKNIKKLTDSQQGIYSVYIYELTTDSAYGFNETTIYTAASVNKLPVLAALYYQAQKGNVDLDDRITIQASDIQDFGTGTLRYEKPGGVYSIKSLAQIMIEKSDNTAVYILTQVIGQTRIQELIGSWNLTQTDIAQNKTSNKDMALLLTKMYKGQIANQALTMEMIGFLDDSDFENRLPALLPKNVKVYHKVGTEVGLTHDVGIVALEKNPYYLGVMVNDVVDETTTEGVLAQISKLVYEFMTR